MSSFIAPSWVTEGSKWCQVSWLWFLPLLVLIPRDKTMVYNTSIRKVIISTNRNQHSFAKQLG